MPASQSDLIAFEAVGRVVSQIRTAELTVPIGLPARLQLKTLQN
jgi:hypothetical protein